MGAVQSQLASSLVQDGIAGIEIPADVTSAARIGRANTEGVLAHKELDAEKRPICVDLDGTLIKTDTLVEGLVSVVSSRSGLMHLGTLLTSSKARLKQRVAEIAGCAPDLLPYDTELIAYLKKKRQEGHYLVLATAADARIANSVASHLGIFDEVICSDVGNDRSDLPIWRAAAGVVTVNASRGVTEAARRLGLPTTTFDTRPALIYAAVRAMRPHQWSKNLLVFVPMIMAHAVGEASAWIGALGLFLCLSAIASCLYIINDLLDLTSDRRHPRKRMRPLASGALSIPIAVGLAVILVLFGLGLGWLSGTIVILLTYAVSSLSYSLVLKCFPLVDVFVLAGLYTLRVLGGGVASGHPATLWLLAFAGFTFLSLAMVKRAGELLSIERSHDRRSNARRGYQPGDAALIQMFGCASAFSSGVVLALFVGSNSAFQQYKAPEVLWLIVPIIIFWHCRLWLATVRGNMHDDPIVYTFRDWVSWIVGATILLIMCAASAGITLS
jgi:4-hydroxybenzoate polyprenyltransferase